jgi:hypothetical protein
MQCDGMIRICTIQVCGVVNWRYLVLPCRKEGLYCVTVRVEKEHETEVAGGTKNQGFLDRLGESPVPAPCNLGKK